MKTTIYIVIGIVVLVILTALLWNRNQFNLPEGETRIMNNSIATSAIEMSDRDVFVTDNVQHSIPLNEILAGGPPKDGIPSIDEPKFVTAAEASFLTDKDAGLGITRNGVSKFYPYQILVWHEIVNDENVLVTYCPLCATGVAFDPRISGKHFEFGVSGKLWQSNLLMYNRTGSEETESLWSQVLGEAVLGPLTGTKLAVVPSDTVRFGDWKKKHPDTLVLSRDTGITRRYGLDPYKSYYTNDTVSFGASFDNEQLHPKTFVLGIEIDGKYKAYHYDALPEGTTTDTFADTTITIEKDSVGSVRLFLGPDKTALPYIGGFWFSWLAVHPETELFK